MLLCQLRYGVLPLQIEIDRYCHKIRAERICKIYQTEVADELHFLFRCREYQPNRVKLVNKIPELITMMIYVNCNICLISLILSEIM